MQSILELADCSRFKTHFQQFGVILPSHSELIIMLRMRKKACSVRGCPNQGLDATDVLHFGFPKELTRFHKWVEFCQNPTLEGRTPRQCTHKFICALHFSRDAFQNELLRKLNRNSLPSLSPPLPALSAPGASSTPSIPIPSSLVLSPSQPSTSFSTSTPTHPRCATHLFFGPSTSNSSEADLGCLPLGDSNELSFATSSAPELCGSSTVAGSSTVSSNSGKKSKSLALSHIHMTRTSEMTPRKTFLFEYGRRKDKALKRLQTKYEGNKKKLRDILYFKKQCFLKKNMSTTVATFLESQLRGYNKKPRGRRYTVDDKIMALSIYKRSPKCYTLLRKLFVLPSKRTLISMVNAVPFRTGFNAQIFTTLAQTMKQMSDCDRLCYVMFDEISLRQNLRYNSRFDFIEGLEDYGHLGRTSLPAKSALVFMLRGLVRKWKQPIAYYFSHSGVKAEILKELIQEVLRACLDAGIHVVATVCDMGSSNVKALKELGSTKHHPVFRFLDHDIVTIYDPPHLLKCTRNSLLNHDVKCTVKTASLEYRATARWDHIHTAYNSDQQFIFRSAPKLTETHINPDSRSKMRVQTAAQVLSHSVAVAVERAVAVGHLSSEALATASFVNTCDSLLDSFNGYKEHPQGGKSLKKRLEEDSPHWEFWRNASREVNSWEFLTPSNIEGQAPKVRRMPSQDGWLVSMKAMELLWAEVTKKCNKVTYLQPRCINQDALENTFGLIRSHCGSNEHPTVWQFVDALKTCIINGLAFRDILQGSNCKEDDASLLSNLRTFICGDHEPSEPKPDNVPTDDDVDDPAPVIVGADEASIPCDISRLSTAYVSGYIARRLLSHNECDDCRAALCCTNLDIYLHIGIELKEYSPDERTLTYPSEKLVCFVSQGANLIDSMLDANKKMDAVKETITRSMKEEIDFTWLSDIACGHGNDLTLRLVEALCTLCISWWCTRQNRQVKDYSKKKRKMRKLNVNV